MVVLDSSFLIALHREDSGAVELFASLEDEVFWVPAAAWLEYVTGLNAPNADPIVTELDRATVFEPFDRPHAEIARRLQVQLGAVGQALGWHDLQIAATALHLQESLVTSDAAFGRIPGLRVLPF